MKLKDITTGGFYLYTEQAYGGHHAEKLIEVRNVDGVDMAHPIATNWRGAYINETPDNWGTDLPVAEYDDERCWHPCDYTTEDGNPATWMAENYPLENTAKQSQPTKQKKKNMAKQNIKLQLGTLIPIDSARACPKCGARDLWDDNGAEGCNRCGYVWGAWI